ncbi:T9SS type A sorting domain-containing protein [Chryseobacterium sp.]|uniref:T9SS type A sorting domain-containing protein n=1 Tax=Chryseobacterium sp. TaxID=1871047 RepID=UPI0033423A95
MKTNLSVSQLIKKTAVLASSLFLMSSLSFAQIVKTYATSQTNQVVGICLGCGVLNPENAVDGNEITYSTLEVSVGLLGRTEQTLIFPQTNIASDTNKLVIGFGADKTMLAAGIASSVSVETFNGTVSNNDYQYLDANNLKLGGSDPTKGEIELTMNKPYDRIKINLNGGLLSVNGAIRLYYAYQYKDPYISFMAHSKDGQVTIGGGLSLAGSEVTLINTSGKEVYRTQLKSNTFETQQPQGVYIMTLQTKEGKSYSQKVMIK